MKDDHHEFECKLYYRISKRVYRNCNAGYHFGSERRDERYLPLLDQGLRGVAGAISEDYGGIKRAGANLPAPYTGPRSQVAGIGDNGEKPSQFGGVCTHNYGFSLYQERV